MSKKILTPEQRIEWLKCAADPVYFINKYGMAFNTSTQSFGKIKCFKYQEKVIDSFLNFQNNIILKSRQCLKENTFVDTPDGPKMIQDFKVGDKLYSYNFLEEKIEEDMVSDAWCSGDRQCVKFKLQDTRNFESGENHPFFVKTKGWVKAKDLVIGDEILDDNVGFGIHNEDEDQIKLLAYLITDGSSVKQVRFTNNNIDYLNEFEKSSNNIFPDLQIRKSKKLNGYDYFPHQEYGTNTLNPAMDWCKKMGIADKHSADKKLPNDVFSWNKKSISLLINRIFAGDGWISIYNRKNNKRLEVGLGSPNLEFLHQIKMLLNKFSIKCNVYEVKKMKLQKNEFFKLRITHSKSVEKFIEQIGIYKKIKEEHIEVLKNRKHDVKNGSVVKKVQITSFNKCYDISVSKNENFFVDGLLTHNTGLSVITAAYIAWRLLFKSHERILVMANDGAGSKRFLEHVKTFIMGCPEFLKPDGQPKWNETNIKLSNYSFVEAKASSPQAGRGGTYTCVVLDEFAFIEKDKEIWTAVSFALSKSKGDCIIISTPYGSGNKYHEFWVEAESGRGVFNPIRVHWTENPDCAVGLEYRPNEKGKMEPWSPWYEEQRKTANYDSTKIAQELDLSFLGSKLLAIDENILLEYRARIVNNKIQPICYIDLKQKERDKLFTSEKTAFWVWEKPLPGEEYLISADIARGAGDDYSTVQVLNAKTLVQAAELQLKIDPDLFANVLHTTALLYNEAYVVAEGNSFGLATTYKLERALNYKNIFYYKTYKKMHVRPTGFDDFAVDKDVEVPGFQTNSKTKPLLVSNLREMMRENSVTINSLRLLNEFNTWVMQTKSGNVVTASHEPGYNDDLIMAMGIGLYVRQTEYENVVKNKKMSKVMLDAYGFNSTPIQASRTEGDKMQEKAEREALEKINPEIMFFKNGLDEENNDDNDPNWILG